MRMRKEDHVLFHSIAGQLARHTLNQPIKTCHTDSHILSSRHRFETPFSIPNSENTTAKINTKKRDSMQHLLNYDVVASLKANNQAGARDLNSQNIENEATLKTQDSIDGNSSTKSVVVRIFQSSSHKLWNARPA